MNFKCTDPYVTSKGEAYGCSRCPACLVKRRRIWTHRIMLEGSLWDHNAYVTLSYEDKYLTWTADGSSMTLVPLQLKKFLVHFRTKTQIAFRYYGVGEYGDTSQRPHFHIALFNVPTCARGRTLRRPGSTRPMWRECCSQCRLVGNVWGKGDVDLGRLENHSAQYVAGYVTKKMTGKRDARLLGRYPEFARMSLKPGLGYGRLADIARVLGQHGLDRLLADVPATLGYGKGKQMPLGRYLRRKLRLMLGREEKCPDEVLRTLQEEMHPLLAVAQETTSHPSMAKYRKEVIRNLIIDANMGLDWKIQGQLQREKKRIKL